MLNEKPPNDGHRRTILFPVHTHVGFGIALQGFHLRLAELYVAKYVRVDPIPQRVKPKQSVLFSGRVLNPENELAGVDVYYEPLPTPPQIEWLRVARSYGMPDERESFQPRLPAGLLYTDGTKGEIEMLAGQFGDKCIVGVGTVLDGETARDAIAAGAQFVVSPMFDERIVENGFEAMRFISSSS